MENAAFPKDVLILMDRSGSMKGVRLEIARSTVKKIFSTLTDDDYFNVITVLLGLHSLSSLVTTVPGR